MNKLEENNINAQVELMSDIISNFRSISYAITAKADDLVAHLGKRIMSNDAKTVTIDKAEFDSIMSIARILQKQDRWDELNNTTKRCVPDNETKVKVLSLLQKK